MKTIKTIYAGIIDQFDNGDIINKGLNDNNVNLYADMINDMQSLSINESVAEFLKENIASLDTDDITNILQNPDWIVRQAADCFSDALANTLNPNGDAGANYRKYKDDADSVMRHVKTWFDAWGNYYVFVNPWSNVCADWYIIRSDSGASAYAELVTRFENDFAVEPDSDITIEYETNDNGIAIATDNLKLIGSFNFEAE